MNGKKARAIRKMAQHEIGSDQGVVDRELVMARINGGRQERVINHPNSVRAMNLALKTAYIKAQRA